MSASKKPDPSRLNQSGTMRCRMNRPVFAYIDEHGLYGMQGQERFKEATNVRSDRAHPHRRSVTTAGDQSRPRRELQKLSNLLVPISALTSTLLRNFPRARPPIKFGAQSTMCVRAKTQAQRR
jgi:hypothetical protein